MPKRRDIKAEIAGRETDIIHALGIPWPPPGHQRHIRCPFPEHEDRHPSWRWDETQARWHCTCGSGDALDAVQRMGRAANFPGAADFARDACGLEKVRKAYTNGHAPAEHGNAAKAMWQPIHPVPADAPKPNLKHYKHGKPITVWEYRDAQGALLGLICRFDLQDGSKEIIPLVYAVHTGDYKRGWRWLSFAKPRPLYGLDLLAERPAAPILLVEGEKTADAAEPMVPDYITMTWPGGTGAVGHVDWEPLRGRDVVLWPDHDLQVYPDNHARAGEQKPPHEQPGLKAMLRIAKALAGTAASVRIVDTYIVDAAFPDGWDLADPMPEGVDVRALLAGAVAPEALVPEATSPTQSVDEKSARATGAFALRCNDQGQPYKDEANVLSALDDAGISLSYDVFADRHIVCGLPGYGPELDQATISELRLMVWREYRLKMPMTDFEPIILSQARRNRFHPVKEYLESLQWDGTERLEHWLVDHGEADDTPYVRAISRLMLVAAVRRIYQPGARFRLMLVLESKQGGAKSSAVETLLPNPEWFEENLALNADPKVVIEHTLGKWIIEIAELGGMRNKDVEHVKTFISRTQDRARLAYARSTTTRPRQFVLIGTTNEAHYLRDSTGNTRFCPVRINEFDLEGLRAIRDQLWAEAMHRHRQGESIALPPELYRDAHNVQESRRITDPWRDELADVLGDLKGKIAAADVWRIVDRQKGQRTQHDNERLGSAMRELGWQRTRAKIGGKTVTAYVRGYPPYRRIRIESFENGKTIALQEQLDLEVDDGCK